MDGPAVLVIAGDGPLRSDLESRIRQDGLEDAVRLVGRVSDSELVGLYQASDINVVPSVALEGFGLIVLEAAACGTPSVVTRIGGLPEAVRGLDESLVVEPGSPGALADRLLGPRPTRDETRAFAAGHSWRSVGTRHARLYAGAAIGATSDKRRVVYLDHTARMSGGEIALLRLLPHLSNIEPHVILAEDGPLADALVAQGISVEVMKMPARARSATRATMRPGRLSPAAVAGSALYTLRLARRLRSLRPDLVHTNSLKAGVYGGLAARAAGIPQVWHVRDRIAADYLPAPAVAVIRFLISKMAAACIANSEATLRTVATPRRAVVLHSVVPEIAHRPAHHADPSRRGATVFGIVGRLAPWKGQDVFLTAFARAFPGGEQRAVVIGSAMFGEEDERYAAGLVALVEELGIKDRVEFRGHRADVPAELANDRCPGARVDDPGTVRNGRRRRHGIGAGRRRERARAVRSRSSPQASTGDLCRPVTWTASRCSYASLTPTLSVARSLLRLVYGDLWTFGHSRWQPLSSASTSSRWEIAQPQVPSVLVPPASDRAVGNASVRDAHARAGDREVGSAARQRHRLTTEGDP